MNRKLSLVCLLLGASACDTKPAASPDAALPPDAARCTSDNTCTTAGLGVCDTGSGTCVQCTASNDTACAGATPVCGTEQTCRACAAHSECDSDVCLPTGACAVASEVAYVEANAPATTGCTQAAPCGTLTQGLAAGKATVLVTGTIQEAAVVVPAAVQLITSAPNAKLEGTSGTAQLLSVTAGNVRIAHLTISGSAGVNPSECLRVDGTAIVTLDRATVTKCQTGVTKLSGGTLTVTGSTISGNETTGISASGGTLTVTGSTISGNDDGGIFIRSADFTLVNNFVINNGLATAQQGGVDLGVSNGKTGRVEFNTIASNLANTPVTAGVFCTNNGNFTFANNIVAGNAMTTGGATNTNQQVGCPTTNNTLLGDLTNLKFQDTNPAAADYKLTTGSVAIDKGTVSTAAPTDFFGTARPKGAAPDHGAHEF